MKRKLCMALLAIHALILQAQIIPPSAVTGSNPSSLKWKYFETPALKIIFPDGNQKEAARIADIINFISDSAAVSIGEKRKHLTMLIQTQQVISNGYVGLMPFRSELFATGIQNQNYLGSLGWMDVLAIHEYRHALQYINNRRGLTKMMYIAGGETLWQLAQNVAIPNWFYEGDAVQTETVLTGAGRGRTPHFFHEQRAQLLNDKKYRYQKARNGSFLTLMPDHYRLGYAMLHQVRWEKGPDVWRKIIKDASAYKGLLYPFSAAMKRHTGYGSRKTYMRTYDTLQTQWKNELNEQKLTPVTQISPEPKRIVTNYEWPYAQADGSIICRREAYNRTQEVVKLSAGKVTTLAVMGLMVTEPYLSVRDDVAAWTELTTDSRFMNRNYSDIVCYSLKTDLKRRVTTHSKLFSPVYSQKRNAFVAVRADEQLRNTIVILDAQTGAVIDSIANPDNDFISYPKWSKDDNSIIYVAKTGYRIRLVRYDMLSRVFTDLTVPTEHVIEGIYPGKNSVYFASGFSGINNLYAVSLSGDKQIRKLSSVKYGLMGPSLNEAEDTVYFTQLGMMGQHVDALALNTVTPENYTVTEPELQNRYRIVTTPVESRIYDRLPKNTTYEAKDYTGAIRSAKLHSWSVTGNQQQATVSLKVNNILNDFGADLTTGINFNENAYFINGRMDYARYRLPFGILAAVNERSIVMPANLSDTGKYSTNATTFTESIYGIGTYLPYTRFDGMYISTVKLYANAALVNLFNYEINDKSDNTRELRPALVECGMDMSVVRGRAIQNLQPRFGAQLSVYYGTAVNSVSASNFRLHSAIYLPGAMRNHGFKFTGAFKQESLQNDYRFFDQFTHARGYIPIQGDREWVFSANYILPLMYPDFGVGGIIYVKRIKANLFLDLSQVSRTELNKSFAQNSAGCELMFDVVNLQWINLSMGTRLNALLNTNYFDRDQTFVQQFYLAGTF
ncbi:MAG: TolB family protein [Bacteroidota bacterium]